MAVAGFAPSLPGPAPTPLLGRRAHFIRFLSNPLRFMRENYATYGPISSVMRDDPTQILAIGPEHNRVLLSDSALFYTVFEKIVPDRLQARGVAGGLLQLNGTQHKQQRRLMQPSFHRKQIELYREDMVGYTQDVLDQWRPGQVLAIGQAMQMLTLRIASKTLFGLDTTAQAAGMGQLIRQALDTPFFSPKIALFPFDLPGTPFRRAARVSDQLNAELLALIQRKRANPDQHYDVLATLIQAHDEDGDTLNDRELLGHVSTLLVAGHETTANTLAWTLLLLDQHPRVLADLVDELRGELDGAAPTLEQLRPESGRLPLLERVLKESMRLLPTAAVTARFSTGPFALGPYHFPANTFVDISAYLTHRLPELYDEPFRFKPERWERINPSPYEYLPFGAGPRMCIGASFAMMELRIVLAMLLQRYRLAVAPGAQVDWTMGITLAPSSPLPMVVAAQDGRAARTPIQGTIHELVDLR